MKQAQLPLGLDAPPGPAAESDPGVSAFVSAHAGAGKTTLLIERLLRLMLGGADPAGILCLTYTKAAAAEMAIRLQRELGALVTMGDAALRARLASLGVAPSAAAMARARGLFARVLDLPGGMRIETIHAFCQSLLRRFPLEAAVSPHFSVLQEMESAAARHAAREAGLDWAEPEALARLAGLVDAKAFAALFTELLCKPEPLGGLLRLTPAARLAAIRRAAGCRAESEEAGLEVALVWPEEAALKAALAIVARDGSNATAAKAADMLGWLSLNRDGRRAAWERWLFHLFTKRGERGAASGFCNDKLAAMHPHIRDLCAAEQARVEAVLAELGAQRCAEATAALIAVVSPMVAHYERAKGGAQLDYDDLIARSAALLREPGAAWVLYKLDARLEHLLLDEVQDTAPAQWRIASDLTAEFFAGVGSKGEAVRTVFAVGDRKQSIYSFQGADPDQFEAWRGEYGRRARDAGAAWREAVLDRSWRSTAPVLAAVDAVFADPEAAQGVCGPGALTHRLMRAGQAGRVELWPLAPRPEGDEVDLWPAPEVNRKRESAVARLVGHLAAWIEAELKHGTRLESAGRALAPGDILVLVRKRDELARALVRALKARKVPVTGLDRMALAEQPAVRDVLSLCEALLLPEDDLRLAEYLTSPLGGLDDASLMALAAGREGRLIEALRARARERADWGEALARFASLLGRVDFASPHALLSEALGPQGGRARLLARLGPEAMEPLDELLSAALLHARAHAPSLQLFLHWLAQSGAEVKREPEAAGEMVRIMTVHGAKGLQAPLVILPDTVGGRKSGAGLVWAEAPGGGEIPLWAPVNAQDCEGVRAARARRARREAEEENRLLYVAMTRAEDRLLVCGAAPHRETEGSWHARIRLGLVRAGAEPVAHPWGEGLRLEAAQTGAPDGRSQVARAVEARLPAWAGRAPDWRHRAPPTEPARPSPLAPSRPEGIERGPPPAARSPLEGGGARFARGRLIHALLQRLPELPPGDWDEAARAYAPEVAEEVLAVLRHPRLAPMFGPGSRAEQPVMGVIGDRVVAGQIDRLAVLPSEVLIADYKTGRAAPASAAGVPVAYVRQMAAYRAVLARVYPGRRIACCLVFTEGPVPVWLPAAMLDEAERGFAGQA